VGERASARREDLVGRGSRTSDKSSQRLWFVRTDRWAMSACATSRWSQDVAISKRDTEMKGAPDQPRERNLHLGLIAPRHMFRRCPRLVITRQGRCENVWVLREPRPTMVLLACGIWVEPAGLARKLDIKAGALIPRTKDFLMSGSEKKNTIPRPRRANRITPRKYQGDIASTKCSFGASVVNVLPRVIMNGAIPPAAPASNAFMFNDSAAEKAIVGAQRSQYAE
jgi:hypothetical protein